MASKTVTAADGWAWTFEGLAKYKDGKEIAYTITEDPVSGYDADVKDYNVTNTHTPATVTISGEKTWVGDANVAAGDPRPESITVYLNADGVRVASKTVTPDQYGKWTYTFENMPKFANGQEIVYTVTEETVEGYTFSNGTDYNIVNTYTPGKTSVTVTKAWEDGSNQDGIRPASIQVQLKIKVLLVEIPVGDPVELNAANQWTYTFTDLDDTYKGVKISYTVAEVDVPEGYEAEVTGNQTDGFTITNTHTPAVTTVSVKKDWSDENDLAGFRPDSVQVQLYKTVGQEIAPVGSPVTLSDENHWEYTWQNLPAKEDGVAISYTVGEAEVEHYTPSITGNMKDGFTITNTHVPQKMAVTVFKTWDDNSNEDNVRPDSVKVTLRRNGTRVGEVTLSEENDWTHTFTNLPVYAEGEVANYTVTEASVNNYQAEYEYTQTNAGMSVEIINHYIPAKTSIDVTKKWTDSGNKAGARPSKVTIYLLANGEKTGDELILTKENNWTGSFEDLPVKKDGKAIVYTISEKAVANYTAKITGNAKDGFVVTNTHVSIPTTGDESNMTMYAVLFSLGAMAVVSALILSRKKYGRRG